MATTSGNLAAGRVASKGGNGNSERYGLKAKMLAGLAILGCATALTFGGLRQGGGGPPQPATAASISQRISIEQQRFLESNTQLPDGGATLRLDWATIWLIEQNQLPETTPADVPGLVPPGPTNFQTEDY